MSSYTGKWDLFDHIITLGTKDKPKYNNKLEYELYCFNLFKQRTGGVIYQKFKLELNPFNIDKEILDRNNDFILSKTERKIYKPDKRTKSGQRVVTEYTYTYLGEDYSSLEELNNRGYYALKRIHFSSIFDIIPYYSFIISVLSSDEFSETIYISNVDYNDKTYFSFRESGIDTDSIENRKNNLITHFVEMARYTEEGKGEK